MRQYGRNPGSNVFALDDGQLAHLDAGDVRDGVVGSGLVDTGVDAKVARSRAMFLSGSQRRPNQECEKRRESSDEQRACGHKWNSSCPCNRAHHFTRSARGRGFGISAIPRRFWRALCRERRDLYRAWRALFGIAWRRAGMPAKSGAAPRAATKAAAGTTWR